jgi:DNA mismatch endonuclease (patch repair protein)
MRRIKAKNSSSELKIRSYLHKIGFRYRIHVPSLPGKPDIVFPTRRKVILVNGCFWHGHDCPRGARKPKTNQDYWKEKIRRNRERDKKTLQRLVESEWEVLIIWECELKDMNTIQKRLLSFLN